MQTKPKSLIFHPSQATVEEQAFKLGGPYLLHDSPFHLTRGFLLLTGFPASGGARYKRQVNTLFWQGSCKQRLIAFATHIIKVLLLEWRGISEDSIRCVYVWQPANRLVGIYSLFREGFSYWTNVTQREKSGAPEGVVGEISRWKQQCCSKVSASSFRSDTSRLKS